MKVTLQRTVDLNQIPAEVEKVVKECSNKLKTISSLASSLDTMDAQKFIDQVDFIRRKLYDVDNSLEESSTIMSGYQRAINQEQDEHKVDSNTEVYEVEQ